MNTYSDYIAAITAAVTQARRLPLGGWLPLPKPNLPTGAAKVLLFSPHPDDEAITGVLPLRLLRQRRMRVVNVAVTLGSNPERREARLKELRGSCDYLGFELFIAGEKGLENINLKSRREKPVSWKDKVATIALILKEERPEVIFFPHARDGNSTHVGVHHLVVDALNLMKPDYSCFCCETEFWAAMDDPNLMVEAAADDVAHLSTALSFHQGEIQRNPYHLHLPAWLIDNVRRGSELVGGQGGCAPPFLFAILYRLRLWKKGIFKEAGAEPSGRLVSAKEDPSVLFSAG